MRRILCKMVWMLAGAVWLLPIATGLSSPCVYAAAPASGDAPQVCFADLFADPLPGRADYCLGLRAWNDAHYASGLASFKRAAGWGNKGAQYTLGLIYYGGHHVPVNVALGIAWLKLANERHNREQVSMVVRSASRWATPAQRHAADRLFHQMLGKYGDKVAAARAWHHLQRWQLNHGPAAGGCIELHGAQAAAVGQLGLAAHASGGRAPDVVSTPVHRSNARPPTSLIGDPLWLRLKANPAPPQLKDAQTVHQARQESDAAVCVPLQVQRQLVQASADTYFRGLIGTVNVGPLEPVPAPVASSHR